MSRNGLAGMPRLFEPPAPIGALQLPEVDTPVPAVEQLIAQMRRRQVGRTFNQYEADAGCAERLRRYLTARWNAPIVLVGEAAGYRGARLSGVAFTSVSQLGIGEAGEASATIVHRALAALGAEEEVLLWNVVPTHPHILGAPESNRAPLVEEIAACGDWLTTVTKGRLAVGVGRVAHGALGRDSLWIRHPAHGGARLFEHGISQVLAKGAA